MVQMLAGNGAENASMVKSWKILRYWQGAGLWCGHCHYMDISFRLPDARRQKNRALKRLTTTTADDDKAAGDTD